MYGVFPYGVETYSAVFSNIIDTVDSDIVYNGYALQGDAIKISSTNFDSGHRIASDFFDIPLGDGGTEQNYYFREKTITMQGRIAKSTAEELNNEIDRFKRILLQNNKNLDIKVNGTIRRAKASVINADQFFNRLHYNITFLPFTITFRVLDKFKEIKAQTNTITGLTGNFNEVEYNTGSTKAEPKCIFVFNSVSSTNTISVTMGGKQINISSTMSNNDILEIDSENKTVKLNDVEIDYLGTFPILDTGENNYSVEVNGTVDFNFTLQYFNTYL